MRAGAVLLLAVGGGRPLAEGIRENATAAVLADAGLVVLCPAQALRMFAADQS
ncbi:hypothetical protein [Actinacidiphila oryziradicis]|jgi:hypothetical protein|uniref:hypothetical protein n=1 Tax=Actinacidiphila oryziradicis TaxID=2571141 RepID=UPI0023F433EE|nr:hypothetical protein [Actinacidiphila oryziradicis]MCW2870045.1 hypothetical protein [Actinacidiphila oryziradicis]